MDILAYLRKFFEEIAESDIIFKRHFHEKALERPISRSLVLKHIRDARTLYAAEEQVSKIGSERKYKLWFRMSSRYSLVLVVSISKKSLYIITGWNSDRKWQKRIQK